VWERLWSTAIYDLRITEEQFFDMTLGMFDLLIERQEMEWERRELLNGILASTVANYAPGLAKNDYREAGDFMPSALRKREKKGGLGRLRNQIRQIKSTWAG
jgi:hypothetical protein